MKYAIDPYEFNQTFELMITPMMLTDETDAPAYLNRAFQSQIGYAIEELPDKNSWLEKAYPDPDYREEIAKSWMVALTSAKNDGDDFHLVSKIYCADGVYRWFDVHQHTIAAKRVVTFLNIDGPMRRSEDLAAIADLKEKLLCILAHDVRGPLSSYKQMVEGYEDEALSEQDVRFLLYKMSTQVDLIFNIMNPLLLRTSGNRGGFIAKREPINLADFFSKYSVYYKARLDDQHSRIVLELPEYAVLNYDPVILDVICRNLLDNAIKFSGNNGLVQVFFKRSAGYARLVIRDTGPGMSTEQVEQIMNNKGSQGMLKGITDSFGLGLVLAKELLEKYQGRLLVESEKGAGTAFIIEITDHFLN
jgi:PAS domain S-box-containing protein